MTMAKALAWCGEASKVVGCHSFPTRSTGASMAGPPIASSLTGPATDNSDAL